MLWAAALRFGRGGCPTASPSQTSRCATRWGRQTEEFGATAYAASSLHGVPALVSPPHNQPTTPNHLPTHAKQVDTRTVWQQHLAEVEDDMETKLLRAQQAELPFTLQVPDKVRQRRRSRCGGRMRRGAAVGPSTMWLYACCLYACSFPSESTPAPHILYIPQGTVCGVLYYYPYQGGQETLPAENPLTSTKPASSPPFAGGGGPATQHPGFSQLPPRATQHMPRATQHAPRATQAPGGGGGGAGGQEEDDDDEAGGSWQSVPIFEAFWQGRLIPGARIDTLPFLEAVRQKRTAQAKVGQSGVVSGTRLLLLSCSPALSVFHCCSLTTRLSLFCPLLLSTG